MHSIENKSSSLLYKIKADFHHLSLRVTALLSEERHGATLGRKQRKNGGPARGTEKTSIVHVCTTVTIPDMFTSFHFIPFHSITCHFPYDSYRLWTAD